MYQQVDFSIIIMFLLYTPCLHNTHKTYLLHSNVQTFKQSLYQNSQCSCQDNTYIRFTPQVRLYQV